MKRFTKLNLKKNTKIIISLFAIILLIGGFLAFLYKERYFNCLFTQYINCIYSQKYESSNGLFSFRYPKGYPLSDMNDPRGQWLKERYADWVNFSDVFYPNAGGDRLGSVQVCTCTPFKTLPDMLNGSIHDYVNFPAAYVHPKSIKGYVKIDGVDAVKVSSQPSVNTFDSPSEKYILIHKGNMYVITFDYNEYYHKAPLEYYENSKQLILSTFTLN